jgi:hypothetical protein
MSIPPSHSARKPRKGVRTYGQGPPQRPAERLSQLEHALVYVLAAPDAERLELLSEADRYTRNLLFMRPVSDLTRRHVYSRVLAALTIEYWSNHDGPGNPLALEMTLQEISASVSDIDTLLAVAG